MFQDLVTHLVRSRWPMPRLLRGLALSLRWVLAGIAFLADVALLLPEKGDCRT